MQILSVTKGHNSRKVLPLPYRTVSTRERLLLRYLYFSLTFRSHSTAGCRVTSDHSKLGSGSQGITLRGCDILINHKGNWRGKCFIIWVWTKKNWLDWLPLPRLRRKSLVWSLATRQLTVGWLLTGASEKRYWLIGRPPTLGLDSSVGRAPVR